MPSMPSARYDSPKEIGHARLDCAMGDRSNEKVRVSIDEEANQALAQRILA